MMKNIRSRNKKAAQGQSLIELALLLPPMLILVFGVIDYARAIQFNNILVAMSREGANLAARSSMTHPGIITALNSTAEPLVMGTDGMVYITQIMGTKVGNNVEARVVKQTRAASGDNDLLSQVWHCTSWDNGNGNCKDDLTSAIATLPMTLSDGEEVYAVETLYNYTVIFNYVMKTGPKLYSQTVL
jgi:hypothetical protein